MHFCTAMVAIGGDTRNVMYRDEFSPISWPEMEVLRIVHGGDAVTEIRPFVDVKQSAAAERNRLAAIYGDEPLRERWGGRNAPTEMTAPEARLSKNTLWKNPLSGMHENTGRDGKSSEMVAIQSGVTNLVPPKVSPKVETVGNYGVLPETRDTDEFYRDDDPASETAPETQTLETAPDAYGATLGAGEKPSRRSRS